MRLQSTTGACATWPPPPPSQSRQILVGATMRHTGAGLAIPDFPLMPGGIVPDHWNAGIAIHFAHRVGAIVVAAMAMATSVYVWQHHRDRVDLAQASPLIITLIVLQVTFGGSHGAGPPTAVDQQTARGRRRGCANDVARHHAVELALSDCGLRIAERGSLQSFTVLLRQTERKNSMSL
jgi:Cytochrome oxidase assembly protein